ncbi:neutral zinc metallopeptidase [Novosphingopyxis sp.]|uniref:KPN_02809 family neutral zinc metallopeptidase n=1 Tax=Novosphingopyxis sp. TaxID=2709690 RepID=UPI003B5B8A8C
MRLDDLEPSDNAHDLGRGGGGFGGGGGGLGGLLGLLPMLLGRKMGIGTIVIIAIVGFFLFSGGGMSFLGGGGPGGQAAQDQSAKTYDTDAEVFSGRVLTSLEQTWSQLLPGYRPASLYFYDQQQQSGCGAAQSAMGPFYCPTDQGVYLDTSFFNQMREQMGAGGDFAEAYVIAHEVGHHIQKLSGIADEVRQRQARAGQAAGNELQVRMELQADCYAGVWAGQNKDRLDPGDVEEGMTAAHAIGDDTLMREAGQAPVESMFTHGTSEQRMRWLKRGIETGDPQQCDTFAARTL